MPSDMIEQDVSRRGFLKGALLGGAALTMSSKLALAEQMMAGRLTAKDIHGVGMKPGRVEMSLNENPVGPSPRALRAIADNMFDINRYVSSFSGDGETPLIEALAAYDGVELPKQERQQFSPGFFRPSPTPYFISYAGSGQILNLLALAYLGKGDGALIDAELGYTDIRRNAGRYEEAGTPVGVTSIPLTGDYLHNLDAMLKAITPKTTLVVITNPNNPTGTLVPYEALERFVSAAPKHVTILIDEAYIHFVRDPNYRPAVPLAITNDNVIVTRTFSKVFGMPGMRLGYAVCNPKIQEKLKYFEARYTFLPLLTLMAGIEAVKDQDHVRRSQQVVWGFRDQCYKAFDRMGLEYIPSEANFMMVNVNRNAEDFYRSLFKRRVKVAARWDETMPTWIRISAGTEQETEVFLNELEYVLGNQG